MYISHKYIPIYIYIYVYIHIIHRKIARIPQINSNKPFFWFIPRCVVKWTSLRDTKKLRAHSAQTVGTEDMKG